MKRNILWCLLLTGLLFNAFGRKSSDIPPAPNPPRLVNDFSKVLTIEQRNRMEQRLVAFNDSTSNVICVVTVNDLGNYSAAQFAYEIGEQWGVRSKQKRNGVVILIKPSNKGDGDVYISVGYDLEGAIPDATAKLIIEDKMIPELQKGHYNAALDSALAYILPLAAGEIKAEDLEEENSPIEIIATIIIITAIAGFTIFIVRYDQKHPHNGTNGGTSSGRRFYVGPTFMGGSSGGSFRGGGFGGFGGSGGFGGGGAGGRF